MNKAEFMAAAQSALGKATVVVKANKVAAGIIAALVVGLIVGAVFF